MNFILVLPLKRYPKKELLKYSFQFLLERETNITILSSLELNEISKYFPEYLKKVKYYCKIKIKIILLTNNIQSY